MSASEMDELRRILAGFSMTDIAQMKTAERPVTSLRSVKKLLDHIPDGQLSWIFRPELTKTAIWQILSYVYENDRHLFDLLFLLLSALPSRLETLPTTSRTPAFRRPAVLRNVWEIISIHPLYRYPTDPPPFNFPPVMLSSGENRLNGYFHLNGMKYFAVFASSSTSSRFRVSFSIGSTAVLRPEFPVSNFPIDVTPFLSEGNNRFCLSADSGDDEVAVAIVPLIHLSDLEIEIDISGRKPFLTGGTVAFCPISHEIIEVPVRGIACAHTENMDLQAYVKSSELSHNWSCPICGKPLPYDELYLDGTAANDLREFILEDPLSFLLDET
jgi:hypothetical protein